MGIENLKFKVQIQNKIGEIRFMSWHGLVKVYSS